jgi:hypothetical protein
LQIESPGHPLRGGFVGKQPQLVHVDVHRPPPGMHAEYRGRVMRSEIGPAILVGVLLERQSSVIENNNT